MSTELLAEFELSPAAVSVTLIDRDDHACPVMEGTGKCVHEAVAAALHRARINFQSDRDELDACIAAMRARPIRFRLHADARLESLGFA